MSILPEVAPSKYKSIFKKHGIQLKQVSHYVGKSYCHTCNILNNTVTLTPEVETKLDELVVQLGGADER